MKTIPSARPLQNGSTLVVAVFVVTLLGLLIGLAFDFTANTAKITRRGEDYSVAQALGNGAIEVAFKRWQAYMASKQASSIPKTTPDANNYTSAKNLAAFTSSLQAGINTAAANTAYTVTSLTIVPVDRSDNPLISQALIYTSEGPLNGVPGWSARTTTYCATAKVAKNYNAASGTSDLAVSVSRYFQQADASLYQAMLFFNDDLELHAGPPMTLYGLVHTNANMYVAAGMSGSLTFQSNVSYTGNKDTLNPAANYNVADSNPNGHVGYIEGVTKTLYAEESSNWNNYKLPSYPNGGSANQLSQVGKLSPIGDTDPGTINAANLNATGTHEIIERPAPVSPSNPNPNPAYPDPDAFQNHRAFTGAGLRVIINRGPPSKTPPTSSPATVHVYAPDPLNPDNSVEIPPSTSKSGADNITASIIKSLTLASGSGEIYDLREGRPINVSTLDMSLLTPALNNYADYNGVLYITDATNADAAGNTGNSDAIRLKKGGTLPDKNINASGIDGLSVVTDGAIYVQGDYNTGTTYLADVGGKVVPSAQPISNTGADPTQYTVTNYTQKPAAVMGDAVMILSNNWTDANSNQPIAARTAIPTTFNAALVSGQVLTTASAASGGAHNFPRFLENWSGLNFTYHGSMVELYASIHFTGHYGTGSVYSPPNRRWFFDDSFLQAPPPGNLRSTTYSRGRWIRNNS